MSTRLDLCRGHGLSSYKLGSAPPFSSHLLTFFLSSTSRSHSSKHFLLQSLSFFDQRKLIAPSLYEAYECTCEFTGDDTQELSRCLSEATHS